MTQERQPQQPQHTAPFVAGATAPQPAAPAVQQPAAPRPHFETLPLASANAPALAPTAVTESALPAAHLPSGSDVGAGAVVGGWRLVRKLGEGGMATVFEAVDAAGRRAALKRVKESARGDKEFIERFLREGRAVAKLDHPHICRVLGGGEAGGAPYMVVELLKGGDVDSLLHAMGGKLPAPAAALLLSQLLEALAFAHERGVVHRDIKPVNVMLSGDGVVKLVDFGIARVVEDAKLTTTGFVVGTPSYMSPEQARGLPLDGRSDLFSVGVMLVEMLTGTNPFVAENATATVMKILLEPAPPLFTLDPAIPGILQKVAAGLLENDPARRYPTARAVLEDLHPYRALVEEQHPGLLRSCLQAPQETARILRAVQASFERERAADLIELGEPGLPAAAVALLRACRLEPDNVESERLLLDLAKRARFDLAPDDPRLRALEEELSTPKAAAAAAPATWRRVADLHRAARNPPGQARALSFYLQRQPDDELAERQWTSLVNGPVSADGPTSRSKARPPTAAQSIKLSTREIVDGVRTGGWKAQLPASAQPVQRRPASQQLQRAPLGAPVHAHAGPAAAPPTGPVVFIGGGAAADEPRGRGLYYAGFAVLFLAGAISVFAWSTREAKRTVQQSVGLAAKAEDVESRVRVETSRELERARDAIARGAASEALSYADHALRLSPTGVDAADAYYIKARARLLSGDELLAESELVKYFDVAPLHHRDQADAKALHATLRGERPGASGSAPTAPPVRLPPSTGMPVGGTR